MLYSRFRPITELSLIEAIQDQYLTRHLPDGRIIYTDHRISTVSGYIPSEVQGKSAFNFFYAEDLPWTTMALRHSMASVYDKSIGNLQCTVHFQCLPARVEKVQLSTGTESILQTTTALSLLHVKFYPSIK